MIMFATMNSSAEARAVRGTTILLLLLVSLNALPGVDGLAIKFSQFYDEACESDSGLVMLIFETGGGFNECKQFYNNDSRISVCDATTGETGVEYYQDGTCTELESEEVDAPSCRTLDSLSDDADCGDNGVPCSSTLECTDDVPSTITSTVVNYVVNEYNDVYCTEPTGNTEVISSPHMVYGAYTGECEQIWRFDEYSISECLADGSTISQHFWPDDNTCSGEVKLQITSSAKSGVPSCYSVAVGGLYYSLVTCTTDDATMEFYTPSPTGAPTEVGSAPSAYTSAWMTDFDDNTATGTPAPIINFDNGGVAETGAPTTDVTGDSTTDTPAPTEVYDDGDAGAETVAPGTDMGLNATGHTPTPTSYFVDEATAYGTPSPSPGDTRVDEAKAGGTPSPSSGGTRVDEASADGSPSPSTGGTRGISATVPPIDISRAGGEDETSPPVGVDEAALANGAIRCVSGAAASGVVLYLALGLLVCISA